MRYMMTMPVTFYFAISVCWKVICKYFCRTYLERENMYADYIISKDTSVHTRIVYEDGFTQQLLELVLKICF